MVITLSARQFGISAAACLGVALGIGFAGHAQAQDQDSNPTAEYAALLEEITARRENLALREFYVQQQQNNIDAMSAQISEVTEADATAELLPIVQEMVAELEKVMVSDLPFRVERRFGLLDDLRDDLQGEGILVSDVYRRAMEIYGIEAAYGLQVGSYTGLNPMPERQGNRYAACLEDPASSVCDLSKEQNQALATGAEIEDLREQLYDGNFIHFGRMALLYLERDSSEGYRYNQETSSWDRLSNSELLGLRQNVRIARGESAIGTMTTPVRVGETGADAS